MKITLQPHEIALARTALRMSQSELGDAVGASQALVGHWENGRRPMLEQHHAALLEVLVQAGVFLRRKRDGALVVEVPAAPAA